MTRTSDGDSEPATTSRLLEWSPSSAQCRCDSTTDGIRSSSTFPTSPDEPMAPTILKLSEFRYKQFQTQFLTTLFSKFFVEPIKLKYFRFTLIAESDESTSRTVFIPRTSCPPNSSSTFQSRTRGRRRNYHHQKVILSLLLVQYFWTNKLLYKYTETKLKQLAVIFELTFTLWSDPKAPPVILFEILMLHFSSGQLLFGTRFEMSCWTGYWLSPRFPILRIYTLNERRLFYTGLKTGTFFNPQTLPAIVTLIVELEIS